MGSDFRLDFGPAGIKLGLAVKIGKQRLKSVDREHGRRKQIAIRQLKLRRRTGTTAKVMKGVSVSVGLARTWSR